MPKDIAQEGPRRRSLYWCLLRRRLNKARDAVAIDARCSATTAAGSPCSARPVRADGYCWWHSPALEAERQAGRRQGGRAKSNASRAKRQLPTESLTLAEVQGLLSVTLKAVIAGRLEPGVGNAAANLARALVAVAGVADFEVQLLELRRELGELRGAAS